MKRGEFGNRRDPSAAGRIGGQVLTYRARLKKKLQSGDARPQPVIAMPPWWLATCEVRKVVEATRYMSERKAQPIYEAAGLTGYERMRNLTLRQRRVLIEELTFWQRSLEQRRRQARGRVAA